MSTVAWKTRPQGGTRRALWLLRAVSRRGGRGLARLLLWPITAYFFAVRAPERRASREFLEQAMQRPLRWWHVARHIHTFAATILDRVYLLGGDIARFDIRPHGLDVLHAQMDRGRGVLIVGSHLGSFDALRVLGTQRPDALIRVVLDRAHSRDMQDLLDALNPQLASSIIDAGMDGPSIVLAIKDAAEQNALVALLADRPQPGDGTVPVSFFGREARLPGSPWLIAATLRMPVVLAFGLYRGGRRYDLHFELFSEGLEIARQHRAAKLAECAQRFADVLERHARSAPYNWFNFFDFWSLDAPHAPSRAADRPAGDGAAARRAA